ncbi:MAG: hypothetical protein AMK72_03340 [Planctomycetes bacterium SM23_25]|nr:MAG: hypothetical protein AMK72_03340 [Planctomycetes bacterium SM23_25]
MRRIRVHKWMVALCTVGMLSLTGCGISLQEAAQAGIFDFVAGTITETLSALVPLADVVGDCLMNPILP